MCRYGVRRGVRDGRRPDDNAGKHGAAPGRRMFAVRADNGNNRGRGIIIIITRTTYDYYRKRLSCRGYTARVYTAQPNIENDRVSAAGGNGNAFNLCGCL